ncbi:SH2 domain protein [Dictyocaulus viviparus]|uniref:Tyrosine-protein kinase n=1 Tax=Dictyocaulus viviparus TaxID=29172 RepID=A0A0D8XXA3_DICVI|nr:SH2 domain protein [Dictyocaulus viviparus]
MTDPKAVNGDKSKIERSEIKADLEHQTWYHGFRPRKDVVALLKEPGDFLVRATDSRNMPEIVISVLNDKKELVNLTIKCDNNKLWTLGVLRKSSKNVPRFQQVAELINYYKDHKLPGHAKLKHGITRPTWLIKHEFVSFDKEKDLIGRGNFCNVYKGVYTRSPEEKTVVAVKICHEGSTSKGFKETKEARDQMLSEAQMMSYYVHNHIIEMFGVACDHPPILIVMEYCPGGDLQSHLKRQQQAIDVGERIVYTMEAARGMRYLHKKNCIHRDLAARNCLISAKGSMKIADFGLSRLVNDLEKADKEEGEKDEPSPQIPLRWMAPESLKRPMKFSTKTDVWSFAMMIYEIFNCGIKPWPDDPPKKIATAIRKCNMPSMPDGTPEELKQLTSQIWVVDPNLRPTMAQLCSSLFALMKKYRPPPPEKFTLNSINGVIRMHTDGVITMEETADNEDEEGPLRPPSSTERNTTEDRAHTTESHHTTEKSQNVISVFQSEKERKPGQSDNDNN